MDDGEDPVQFKFIPFDTFNIRYNNFVQSDILFAVNKAYFYENPWTIYPVIEYDISFLEVDEFHHYYLKGWRDEFEYRGVIDNLFTSFSV